jgi:hypothetical protein
MPYSMQMMGHGGASPVTNRGGASPVANRGHLLLVDITAAPCRTLEPKPCIMVTPHLLLIAETAGPCRRCPCCEPGVRWSWQRPADRTGAASRRCWQLLAASRDSGQHTLSGSETAEDPPGPSGKRGCSGYLHTAQGKVGL